MEIGMSQHDIAYRFRQKGTQDPYSGSWSSCLSRRTRSTLKTVNKTILHLITKLVQEELLVNSISITSRREGSKETEKSPLFGLLSK